MAKQRNSLDQRVNDSYHIVPGLVHIAQCEESGAIAWLGDHDEEIDCCHSYGLARLDTSRDGYQKERLTRQGREMLEQVMKYTARKITKRVYYLALKRK